MGSAIPRTRRCALAVAFALELGVAGCATERPTMAGPGDAPGALPDGAFSWQEIRGGHDRLDPFQDLRDRSLALVEQALSLPGRAAGASSADPATRDGAPGRAADEALGAMRAAFDVTRAPEELHGRLIYFDRDRRGDPRGKGEDTAPSEGIEILLERALPHGRKQALRVRLEDFARSGSVDGRLDRIAIRWSSAQPPAPDVAVDGSVVERLSVDLAVDREQVFGTIEIGDGARFGVTSPHLQALIQRAEADLYRHLAGATFARAVRDGTAPMRFRPAPPRGTSFASPLAPEEPN